MSALRPSLAPRVALPVLCALAGAVPAADWSLAPHFGLNGEYNTNPYLQPQSSGDRSGGTFDASFPLGAKTETTDFKLGLDAHVWRYNNDVLQNRDDEKLSATINQTGEHNSWGSSAAWTRDTTLTSELGTTGLTQTNKRHNRYEASISPQVQLSERGLVSFGISGELDRYKDAALTGLFDYSYGSVYAGYSRLVSELTSIGFGGVASGQSVPDRSSSDTVNALLRLILSHDFSDRLHLESYAGPNYVHSQTRHRWGAAGRLALKYGGLRTDFSFAAERQLAPAGLGNLTLQDSASLNMTNRLKEKLSIDTTLAYQRSRDALTIAGTSVYRTYYWRAEESLHWQSTETVSIGLAAGAIRQKSSGQVAYADGFVARLGINWTPRPLF
jgi:hypothetical protein